MTYDQAWKIQEVWKDKPHGWIQWKGTDVCMDVHCKCGYISHVDADFTYVIQCPKCLQKYFVNGHVQFIPIVETDNMNCVQAQLNFEDIED